MEKFSLFLRMLFYKLRQKTFNFCDEMMQTETQVQSSVSMQNELVIPNEIWDAARQLAGRLGLSSNELFATALSDFIRRYGEIDITAELDKVYSNIDSTIDPVLGAMQFRSL